ncbi:hypothetical protein PTSG_05858 [Salpingoeca rosetta]|uniref:Mitochondrial carrier protein n=1 Tax=Salpingoeca rosetta (strain ATCC 50818 / BSB-021) TaxID=946362 RepID=F2UCZ9_SALR5|nr:uncharacterized protein PTSG_05858 [Salpingoeca rosetta]EGD74494.1 hypothetical protein PTSG_05858 [Salpingoeca rosetta]|eukprot:XP_004992751.1 hypothetical protein PTSG_05858 [Salpingoeca rosetta]
MADMLIDLAMSPLATVKTLMMLGYEPREEYMSKSLFKGTGWRRAGAVTFGRELYRQHGILSLAGSWPISFFEAKSKQYVTQRVQAYLRGAVQRAFPSVEEDTVLGRLTFGCVEVVSNCVGSIVVHPLKVLSIHTMASIVETDGPAKFQPITIASNIYNTTGIEGFYRGLTAQLIFDCVKVISVRACEAFLSATGIIDTIKASVLPEDGAGAPEQEAQNVFLSILPGLMATSLAAYLYHPWDVISRMMCISGSNLRLANAPFQRDFSSFRDCYRFRDNSYLSTRGLFRGASIAARFYKTPLPILK